MNDPSMVSNRHIPAMNRMGRHKIAYHGSAKAAPALASTSSEISVAVSNPKPNSTPTGYMCHGLRTATMTRLRMRFMKPRLARSCSSVCSWCCCVRISRKTCTMPSRMNRLTMPRIIRKTPETRVPTIPVTACRAELPSAT